MKNIRKVLKNNTWLVILTIVGAALLLTPLAIFSYLLAIYFGSVILFSSVRKDIGVFTSFFIALLVITCLQQIFGILFWLLGITPHASLITLFLLLAESLYILYARLDLRRPHTNKLEVISIVVASTSVLFIAAGMLRGEGFDTQMLRFITRGFDSSTHLSLVMTTYDNQGYVYGPSEKVHDDVVFASLTAYPQGWHLVNSSAWHMITDKLAFSDLKTLLVFFFATVLVWYFLLIFAICRFICEIASLASSKIPTTVLTVGVFALAFLVQTAIALSLLRYGFVNYIGLIIYILGILTLALLKFSERISSKQLILVGTILSSGAVFTWLLAAPVGFAVILSTLLPDLNIKNLRHMTAQWQKHIVTAILVTGLLLVSLVQVYLQVKHSTLPNNIAADTLIWSSNHLLILFAVVSTITFAASQKAFEGKLRLSQGFLYICLAVLIIPALLYVYQFISEGRTGYYFEKMGAILTIIFLCTSGAILLGWLNGAFLRYGKFAVSLVAIAMFMSAPAVFGIDAKELHFAAGKDWTMSGGTAQQINGLSNDQINKNNAFVAKQYDYEEDVISTHFMNVVSRKETRCSSFIGWNQIIRSYDVMAGEIKRCALADSKTTYTVIASKVTQEFWKHKLGDIQNVDILVQD